jgi:hypothetical protein
VKKEFVRAVREVAVYPHQVAAGAERMPKAVICRQVKITTVTKALIMKEALWEEIL